MYAQGPAPYPYEGNRAWTELSIEEQDRFLLACGGGDLAWNQAMEQLSLKWATAWSITSSIYPYGTPPETDNDALERLHAAIRMHGNGSPFSQRLQRALARAKGDKTEGPEPEIPLGLPKENDDELDSDVASQNAPPVSISAVNRTPSYSGTSNVVVGVALIIALIGLLPMPYVYYVALRLAFCVALCWLSWRIVISGGMRRAWLLVSIPLIVLYNPIAPVHLGSKFLWIAINLGTVGIMWGMAIASEQHESA